MAKVLSLLTPSLFSCIGGFGEFGENFVVMFTKKYKTLASIAYYRGLHKRVGSRH